MEYTEVQIQVTCEARVASLMSHSVGEPKLGKLAAGTPVGNTPMVANLEVLTLLKSH